jgi:hypothetical protein
MWRFGNDCYSPAPCVAQVIVIPMQNLAQVAGL